MRKRSGIIFENGKSKYITCVVTGEMADRRKVWTEINDNELIIKKQYLLQTNGGFSEFIKL